MLGKHYLCAVVTQDAATNGQAAPASSSSLGSRQGLWRTWATPKANEIPTGKNAQGGLSLTSQNSNGKLNPRWVETLMGIPIGWTMPSCTSPQTIAPMSCDSLAMELCRPPQSGLSEFSLAS
jgi:hypothetical protein